MVSKTFYELLKDDFLSKWTNEHKKTFSEVERQN